MSMRGTLRIPASATLAAIAALSSAINSLDKYLAVDRLRGDSAANNFRLKM